MRSSSVFLLFGFLLIFVGCAQFLPVPGGSDKTNYTFYNSEEEFLKIIRHLESGMSQDKVFFRLGVTEEELVRLDRSEIVEVIYGRDRGQFNGTFQEQQSAQNFLRALYGYKFDYMVIEREHGFSSLIRIDTKETGFRYSVALIFKEGYLLEKPVLSGGSVNGSRSSTVFDFFNPGMIIDRVR